MLNTSRPITATTGGFGNLGLQSEIENREDNPQKSDSSPFSPQKSEDINLQLAGQQNPKNLDDSEELYRNQRFQSHQDKDAKSYIKKVLLDDIVFHKIAG